MKYRRDFVTNSSSSCFVVNKRYDGKNFTTIEVRNILQILIDTHNKINNTNIELDDICVITDTKDSEVLNTLFEDECWGDGESGINCPLTYERQNELDYPNCKDCPERTERCKTYNDVCIAGDVTIFGHENAIPYELFDCIEGYLNARRYHLG